MDTQLPPVLLEAARRPQGLLLLTGTRFSSLDVTLKALIQAGGDRRVFQWDGRQECPADADVVVCGGDPAPELLLQSLAFSEEGRLVILVQMCPTPLGGLRRLLSFDGGRGRGHVVDRLSDQLILLSGQMRLRSLQAGAWEEAREIILMTPAIRTAIRQEDLTVVEGLLKNGDETSGMVSFNQSLLQLLLRRKIDIKTAFEASWDPGHLDQILKKVGI